MFLRVKNEAEILSKLGIEMLNPMQLAAKDTLAVHNNVVLLSPTGTGKTLAFLLKMARILEENPTGQVLILSPTI